MAYTTTTLGDAITAVAGRLADPSLVRWSSAELTGYIQEALRTWNAFAGFYRDVAVFPTVATEPFYDLTAVAAGVLGYTVTDRDLVGAIQLRLLEPLSPTTWTGSDQFTLADVVAAIQRRRDQFLLATGAVLTRQTFTAIPTMGGRIPLDQSIATVRRVAFQNSDGVTPLHREDVWAFSHFATGWVQSAGRPPETPFGYATGETPPLTLQIVPPISDRGTLDLIAVTRGAVLNPVTPVLLGIPDDWAWVVTFGALADLLSKDGLASDPNRAQYCQARWDQGIALAQTRGLVLSGRVNNISCAVASVAEADQYRAGWQGVTGPPTTVLLTTGTLLALSPVPDGVYSITVDVVRNAPVPVLTTDFLQVGPELLDAIYDYAEHLAVFKEGAPALSDTQPLLDRFMSLAGVQVALETAESPNRRPLKTQNQRSESQTPRLGGSGTTTAGKAATA